MPGTDVLAALATYLESGMPKNDGPVTFLNAVLPHPPRFVGEYVAYSGNAPGVAASGAIIWLSLGQQGSYRVTLQGKPAGGKMYEYEMKFQCVLLSTKRKTEDAAADNDTFIDALCGWIEHDKNAGNPTVIFEWGEGRYPNGGRDLVFNRGWPRPRKQGVVHVYTAGTVIANEWHGDF